MGRVVRSETFCAVSRLSEGRTKPEPDLRGFGAAARRRFGLFVLVFFFRIESLRRRRHAWRGNAAEIVETRLLTRAGRRNGASGQRLAHGAAQHPAETGLPAQQRVHDHAEPGRAMIGLGVVIDLVINFLVRRRGRLLRMARPSQAGRDGQGQHGGKSEGRGQSDQGHAVERRAEQYSR